MELTIGEHDIRTSPAVLEPIEAAKMTGITEGEATVLSFSSPPDPKPAQFRSTPDFRRHLPPERANLPI